ncbi:MAG: hypothetical protein HY692_08905 [Cyanobacteria bacterium NC_groundwater_1444_Ag_S-0.65um_54_12]|nr:hypothetical protein [Cyanobacteria bacterium NC_groundwater_1444_Ag_S-0.65um_54_12]
MKALLANQESRVKFSLARALVTTLAATVTVGWCVGVNAQGMKMSSDSPQPVANPTPAANPVAEAPKISGKAFIRHYTRTLDEDKAGTRAAVNNESALDRVYLVFDWKPWANGKVKAVLEGGDLRDPGGKYFDVATKAFFLEVGNLPLGASLQVGQLDLPWVGYVDGMWGYRVQGTNFVDRSGYMTSTDIGLGLKGSLAELGEWQFNLVNGEGWKAPEAGFHKDFHGRLTLRPLAPMGMKEFFVSGAGALGTYDPGVVSTPSAQFDKNRYIAQVGYHSKGNLLVAFDYLLSASDPASKMAGKYPSLNDASLKDKLANGSGFSAYTVLNLGLFGTLEALKPLDLIGRYDSIDPDTSLANNGMNRLIAGLGINWNKWVTTLLAYEAVNYELEFAAKGNTDPAKGKPAEQKVMLTSEVRY